VNADRKAEKAHKRAAKKSYDRNHAQLKRQQAMHSSLLAAQLKRGKKQAKRDAR
jgi:hypothetical protein